MSPEDIERVFGRDRLRMTTGRHVEVFRERADPGDRRCYTKRFLSTNDGDYREWTEREWRILARMVGHGIRCVPEVVQFDRGVGGATPLVKTYDAGVTVDHWAVLLPVQRSGAAVRCIFDDCAHWWALADIHALQLIHLDIKADNVCIPIGPPGFAPTPPGQRLHPEFEQLALIDFAFSLVSGEQLKTPLPIARQTEYNYQSPRLLHALEAGRQGDLRPTRELDWRCDLFSLAAMLERYLPRAERMREAALPSGWTQAYFASAQALLCAIRKSHDAEATETRPHRDLIERSGAPLRNHDLIESIERGWTLGQDVTAAATPTRPTPVTRLAPPIDPIQNNAAQASPGPSRPTQRRRLRWLVAAGLAAAVLLTAIYVVLWGNPAPGPAVARRQPVEFTARANDILAKALPGAAAQAEKEIAWVMFVAANAGSVAEDADISDAAARIKAPPPLLTGQVGSEDARRLNESARDALLTRRNVSEAFRLQLRAFGANPQDPETAGNLASLYLMLNPPQAETSRQLAIYAVALRHSRSRTARSEDWATLAVSSALSRREPDAVNALFVMAALSKDLDASCRLARSMVTAHGARMRAPVEAMMNRVRSRSNGATPPSCA